MITSTAFASKRYAVLGLARSGAAAVEALLASGAEVTVWDRQPDARAAYEGRCTIADPLEMDLTGYDGVVVSPGVPLNTHPIGPHAAQYRVPVIGDIELFAQARAALPPHKVVGVTGTNGKSTTVALIHHILTNAGVPCVLGGNIGEPILAQEPLTPNEQGVGVYVLELSSFQIDLTRSLDCDVAALTNITPDHLDRYTGFAEYAASKERLFEMQGDGRVAIVSGEDAASRGIAERLAQRHLLLIDIDMAEIKAHGVGTALSPSLAGPHNAQNAAVALAIAANCGVSQEQVAASLASYTGLPHRMEIVCEENGVLFINDSKATNTASTAPALAAYPPLDGRARLHWIVGGLPKEEGLGDCAAHLGNLAAAYTVGEAGPSLAEHLAGKVPRLERCELISEAVRRAREQAQPGDIVLLSPACASYDQFRDYEKRGEHFRQLVGVMVNCEADSDDANAQPGEAA